MRTIPTILAATAIAAAPVVLSAPQAHADKCAGMTPSDTIRCENEQQILNQPPPQVAQNPTPEEEDPYRNEYGPGDRHGPAGPYAPNVPVLPIEPEPQPVQPPSHPLG